MPVPTPSDAELDAYIKARLALAGVDLSQLPPTQTDPVTGAPSQASVLASLRSFVAGSANAQGVRTGGSPRVINRWQPTAASDQLAQQEAPPALYPSIYSAWTDGGITTGNER